MEGNGYYAEGDQGYGDGWGTNNRRNVGMYTNDSAYMQRGLYYGSSTAYGTDMGTQRMTSLTGYANMGQPPRMQTNLNSMYSDMTSERMSYGYGEMDTSASSQQDTGDQAAVNTYDYNASSVTPQNSYQQRVDSASHKRIVSSYESDMALMQGGSYAGSSPYGRPAPKKQSTTTDYSGSLKGGALSSDVQKGSSAYKSVAPPDAGPFSYEYEQYTAQKRPLGFSDYKPRMFDDSRHRLGTGMGTRGRGRGRGGRGGFGDDANQRGVKRNDFGFQQGGPYPKKKKAPISGTKNPVSFLNEIRPNIEFDVGEMEGPSNMPTFTVSVEFDGERYTASARSKKIAKRYAAEAALKVYLKTPGAKQLGYAEDMIEFSNGVEEGASQQGNHVTTQSKPKAATAPPAKEDDTSVGGKNPVMYLNELKKDAVYDLKEETGMAHNKNFIMRVTVAGQTFEGSGPNKKVAKAAAAREALKTLGLQKQE